jgi:alanine dehydrogenase
MKIGLLKEIKTSEQRVLLIPRDVQQLTEAGHEVYVENGAGTYSNFDDSAYESVGAKIVPTSEKVFQLVEFILKVEAPMPVEYELFLPKHLSFSFLHLPNNIDRLNALLKSQSIFIAAETIKNGQNIRPILSAMSDIAGKLAIHQGAKLLEFASGGKGLLLSGTKGVSPARVTIIGAGNAGSAAARFALAQDCYVNLMDSDYQKLEHFKFKVPDPRLEIFEYSRSILREVILETDILITSVQNAEQKAPVLVRKEEVKLLSPGSVIIDLSIDQGGCVETSRPTTTENPTFIHEGIVHYCVANLPSLVPYTSSQALSGAVLPYVQLIAQLGCEEAIAIHPEIRSGLNLYRGKVVNAGLAKAVNLEYYDILELLELNI